MTPPAKDGRSRAKGFPSAPAFRHGDGPWHHEHARGQEDPGHRRSRFSRTSADPEARRAGSGTGEHHGPGVSRYDLRLREACAEVVAGQDLVIHLAANAGGIGWNRRTRRALLRQRRHGIHLMEEARKAAFPSSSRSAPSAPTRSSPPASVPRGDCGGVPRTHQRAVRHRQEGADGDGAGVPPGVRLQRDLPAPVNLYGPAIISSTRESTSSGVDPEIRGRRESGAPGSRCGGAASTGGPPSPASSSTWRTPPRGSRWRRSGTTERSR